MKRPARRPARPKRRAAAPSVPAEIEAASRSGPTFRRFAPVEVSLSLNGRTVSARVDPSRTLLDFLRCDCGLTGTKEGCGKGECGACTVLMDGKPVNACLVMAVQAEGAEIVTIEGLADRWCEHRGADAGRLHPIQRGFIEGGGTQCGICTPGFLLAAVALLERTPDPTEAEIAKAFEGNLCRCTGYRKIFESVRRAVEIAKAVR